MKQEVCFFWSVFFCVLGWNGKNSTFAFFKKQLDFLFALCFSCRFFFSTAHVTVWPLPLRSSACPAWRTCRCPASTSFGKCVYTLKAAAGAFRHESFNANIHTASSATHTHTKTKPSPVGRWLGERWFLRLEEEHLALENWLFCKSKWRLNENPA